MAGIATAMDLAGAAPALDCDCLATGPQAQALALRRDKINASRTMFGGCFMGTARTLQMWGHPSLLEDA